MKKILVLGIGNLLMGDEGVGIHAIRQLEESSLISDVTFLDGGTAGFHLLSYFEDYETIIMIDATMDGKPTGTISVVEPRFASDFPRALSAHEIGLRDLVESVTLLHSFPRTYLITVSITEVSPMCLDLSPAVKESLRGISETVREIVRSEQVKSQTTAVFPASPQGQTT